MEEQIKLAEEWLTVKQVAGYINATTRAVYSYINRGMLPATKIGAHKVVHKDALQTFQRPRVGREKTRTATWKPQARSNKQFVSTIKLRVKEGQQAYLQGLLQAIQDGQYFIMTGVTTQRIIQSKDDPGEIMLILVWGKLDMPPEKERLQELVKMRDELNSLFDWEHAQWMEGEALLNT